MAGSSTTVTKTRGPYQVLSRIDIAYVADDSDGSIPDTALGDCSGFIVGVTHAAGGTPATNLFDVVAEDTNTVDVLCGAGTNIAVAADMQRVPYPDSTSYGPFPTVGDLTVKFTNNSVNSAVGTFSIFIA